MKLKKEILILLIPILTFSCSSTKKNIINQNAFCKMQNIEFKSEYKGNNRYVSLLNLSDENSLIIKVSYWSYWSKGKEFADFIVYQNDGKVLVYFTSLSTTKNKIKRKRINKSKEQIYWKFLDRCISNNKFNINQNRLNITEKHNDDGTTSFITVSDGLNYQFEIVKGKESTIYHTYSPDSYTKSKFPGWKEREKLVKLIKEIDSLLPEK